jgi:GNAT superfamily N-acetyltransferase
MAGDPRGAGLATIAGMADATGTPVLRPGTAEDAAAVADLWHRGWHDAHPGHVPEGLTAARTAAEFHDRARGRVDDTTVAEVDGEVAGFVMVVGDEVEQVYVDGKHRGTDLAGVLLDEAERQVAGQGHDEAWLAVVVGNARARRFYERRGWTDGGDLPYEVTADGRRFVSPCRRYVKRLG